MKRKINRVVSATLLSLLVVTLVSSVALAFLYRAPVTITENASTSYDMLPVLWNQNNTWLASNGFMNSTANDTRVQTLGGLNKPWMVADNKTLAAIPVPADSQTNLYFTTGESEASAMDIIVGYGGYWTIGDDPTIELGNDFSVEAAGWFDATASGNITAKDDAINIYGNGSGNVTASIFPIFPTIGLQTASGSISGASATVTYPSYTAGDLILITVSAYNVTGAQDITPQAGFTQLYKTAVNLSGTYWCQGAWYKVADGTEGASGTWNFAPNAVHAGWEGFKIEQGTYTGIPVAGVMASGEATAPNPPSLTSGFGAVPTLWFAFAGATAAQGAAPANYTNFISNVYTSSAEREYTIATENPGAFDTVANSWVTNTVAIEGETPSVTASGVSSGERTVQTEISDRVNDGDWLTGWDYRIPITIDATKIDADLTQYPVLLTVTDADVFSELGAESLKLAVTQSDGTTEMYVDVEEWDNVGGVAYLWTSLAGWVIDDAVDTTIYLYYDAGHADNANVGLSGSVAAQSVWDANYQVVYHMPDGADTSSLYDSTDSNYDGAKVAPGQPAEAAAVIGDGQLFTIATSDYVSVGNALDIGGNVAVSMLFNLSGVVGNQDLYDNANGAVLAGTHIYLVGNELQVAHNVAGGYYRIQYPGIAAATWYDLQMTFDGTTLTLYLNGSPVGTDTTTTATGRSVTTAVLGKRSDAASYYLGGTEDEVRVSDTFRSAAWVKADKNNFAGTLVSFGSEEQRAAFSIYVDTVLEDTIDGADLSVPDNANDYTIGEDDIFPYMDYLSISVGGTEVSRYEPTSMIIGTTLPDEVGANDGTIVWGANPAGVGAALGSFTSSGQPDIGAASDTSTSDILPPVGGTDWRPAATVSATLQANPMRPIVTAISDNTTLSEYQVWVWFGIIFVVLVFALVASHVNGHHLITGIAVSAAIILLVVWTIFPWGVLLIVVLAIWLGLVSERSPSL